MLTDIKVENIFRIMNKYLDVDIEKFMLERQSQKFC